MPASTRGFARFSVPPSKREQMNVLLTTQHTQRRLAESPYSRSTQRRLACVQCMYSSAVNLFGAGSSIHLFEWFWIHASAAA